MNVKHIMAVTGIVLMSLISWARGEDNFPANLKFSGFASLQEGQIVNGGGGEGYHSKPRAVTDHVWIQELYTGFNVQALFDNLPIECNIGLELRVGNEYPRYYPDLGKTRRLYFYPYLARADLKASFGDEEFPFLSVSAGYFPFKYNKEVRNLGEYLFRSGTYPQYLITEFDFPMNRLTGLHLSGNITKHINWHVLATTNIEWTALGDLNVAAIVSGKTPLPIVEVGAGASYSSLISVNDNFTSPKVPANRYVENGDTMYYTFAGAKLMGRLTINPQAFFPDNKLFGPNDLKLYGEIAVLGVKNYPVSVDSFTYYNDRSQRTPVMFGFNFPAFKILDVLSLEFEYYKYQYPNDMSSIIYDNVPLPLSSLRNMTNEASMNYHKDDWKWSVYGKKTLAERFHVTFQFARDHMRWYKMDFGEMDWREALRGTKDWAWTIKLGYSL